MKQDLSKRNKQIFKLYVNNKLDIEKVSKELGIQANTIIMIIKNYVQNSKDKQDIIDYNQQKVFEKTNMSRQQLKTLYELFVKYNWNIPIDNKLVNESSRDLNNLYMSAKLYEMFFVELRSNIIYDKSHLHYSEPENLKIAQDIVNCYMEEKTKHIFLSKEAFCLKRKILLSQLYRYISLIKKQDKLLYKKYEHLEQELKEKKALEEAHNIYLLAEQINKGKEDQGIIRKYDSIDFELDFNNNVVQISEITKELYRQRKITIFQLQSINTFFKKIGFIKTNYSQYDHNYPTFNDQELTEALNSYCEINCLKDKNGYPIKGTGKVIAYDENKEVIDYLTNNNLTLNCINFQSGINRIKLGIKLQAKTKKLK